MTGTQDTLTEEEAPTRTEYAGGTTLWILNGLLHRVGGPAVRHEDGTLEWYLHGERHRTDGPAIEFPNGSREWYLHDVWLAEDEHADFLGLPEAARDIALTLIADETDPADALKAAALLAVA